MYRSLRPRINPSKDQPQTIISPEQCDLLVIKRMKQKCPIGLWTSKKNPRIQSDSSLIRESPSETVQYWENRLPFTYTLRPSHPRLQISQPARFYCYGYTPNLPICPYYFDSNLPIFFLKRPYIGADKYRGVVRRS